MPVKLITGATGDGKSHLAMKWAKEELAKGRPVFTNIEGCTLEGVEPIPKNSRGELDWQLCPQADSEAGKLGAFIIYDETQKLRDNNDFRYFAWKGKEKLSDRKVISELDYHRHFGYDIVFITQEPNLLHLHLLAFVKEHYHCSRPLNKKGSQVALWRSWQTKPNSEAAVARAEDVFFIPFEDDIFDQYTSTEQVTDNKVRIPKYMKKLAAIAAFCFIGIVGLFVGIDNPFFNIKAMTALSGNKEGIDEMNKYMPKDLQNAQDKLKETKSALETTVGAKPTDAENLKLDQACSKQYGLSVAQCADLRDPTKRNAQLAATNPVPTIAYDPNKPYDLQSVQESVNYTVTSKPVFSGCAKYNGRYVAYTQQGTILNEVSQSDCRKLIENGDRPFNYFASDKSTQTSNPGIEKLIENSNL